MVIPNDCPLRGFFYLFFFLGLGIRSVVDVFGCLFAVLGLMNLPVTDDLLTVLVLVFLAISEFSFYLFISVYVVALL